MTRKCVLCKESNYKNNHSFFSAPKDPETRKKWQDAIAIENYIVTDETYVCSKHFHKNDIITHWVSGVPPHVVTIRYKKCRLRPGAVPGRNFSTKYIIHKTPKRSDDYEIKSNSFSVLNSEEDHVELEKENFLIPRERAENDMNEDNNESSVSDYLGIFNCKEETMENEEANYMHNKDKLDENSINSDKNHIDYELPLDELKESDPNLTDSTHKQYDKTYKRDNIASNFTNKKCEKTDSTDEENFKLHVNQNYSERKISVYTKKSKKTKNFGIKESDLTENLDVKNDSVNNKNYKSIKIEEREDELSDRSILLFEDLLEICTEIVLPSNWSCVVLSEGYATTITYVYMSMSKHGIPYIEKQVFIKSDMIMRCTAVNQEINPVIHNLVREGRHVKIRNLIDIEDFIDEFDQRRVCKGAINISSSEKNISEIAYKDGFKWRHVLCPLLINSDSLQCSKCVALTRLMGHRPFTRFSNNSQKFRPKDKSKQCLKFPIMKRININNINQEYIKMDKR